MYKQTDIVVVKFPFTDGSEFKNRVGSKGLFPLLSSHTTVRTGLVHGGLLE